MIEFKFSANTKARKCISSCVYNYKLKTLDELGRKGYECILHKVTITIDTKPN